MYEPSDRMVLYNTGEAEKGDKGASDTNLPAVDETGLPRTKRHLVQASNQEVVQFNTLRSNFVPRERGIDGSGFHSLNIQSVSRAEQELE